MWKSIIIIISLIGYSAAGPLASRHHVRFKSRQDRSNEQIANADVVKPNAGSATETISANDGSSARHTSKLNLPSNATSIRSDIKDSFSCENRIYGYYADMENDCQIFHVCMPVTYADGKEHYFRWSFICPEDTVFSQDSFTCMHRQNMLIDCSESMQYYELNRNLGLYTTEEPYRQPLRSNNKNRPNNADQEVSLSNQEEILTEEKVQINENAQEILGPKPTEPTIMPVKSYKPSRRKPVKTFVRPTEAALVTTTETSINIKAEPVVVKKTIQKTYKRPSTLKKNKPQMVDENVKNPIKPNVLTLNPTVQKTEDQTSQSEHEVPVTESSEKIQVNESLLASEPEPAQSLLSNTVVSNLEITHTESEKPMEHEDIESEDGNLAILNKEPAEEEKTESTVSMSIQSSEPETNVNADTSDNESNVDSIKPSTLSDEDKNFLKQTAGGFPAVDSTMAAEAEALINDFLQTMLKSENTNVESMISTELPIPEEEVQKPNSPIEDAQLPATQYPAQMNPFPIHEEIAEAAAESAVPVKSEPIEMMSDSFQIPVAVVQTPFEELQDTLKNKQQEEPIDKQDHYSPISIDDVVASVKERLDQTVASETDKVLETNANETKRDEELLAPQAPENIIIPIYHRFPDSSASAQLENVENPQADKETSAQIMQTDVGSETESQSTTS